MSIRKYLVQLRHWWRIPVFGVLASGLGASLVVRQLPPVYQAQVTVLVNTAASPGTTTYGDVAFSQQLVKTYVQMAEQPVVLEVVGKRLNSPVSVDEIARAITIQPIRDTQLFTITAEGPNPELVRDMANTVAEVFIEQQNQRINLSLVSNAISIAQPALLPTSPVGPRMLTNILIAIVLGLLVSLVITSLLEYLDDTIKSPEEVEELVSLPTIGLVNQLNSLDGVRPSNLLELTNEPSPAAEMYRLLRTNMSFAAFEKPLRSILVTSAGSSDGKSLTVANLSIVLAQGGQRVIAVDADLRAPALHRLFGLNNQRGLTNLLLAFQTCPSSTILAENLQDSLIPTLKVLPSGPLPPNPVELLQSKQFSMILQELRRLADIVVIDSPATLGMADALVLAQHVDGTLVVVNSKNARPEQLQRTVAGLRQSGTRIIGVVLNNLSQRTGGGYYNYDYDRRNRTNGRRSWNPRTWLNLGAKHSPEGS